MNTETQPILPILQAMLFASQEPVASEQLLEILQVDFVDLTAKDLAGYLSAMEDFLAGSGLELTESDLGFRVEVKQEYLDFVYKLFAQKPPRLSRALLETLAILAHKQPATRAEIEEVRGVAVSSQIMGQLRQFGWVRTAGTKQVPGRPTLWVTTEKLLNDLGISEKQQLIDELEQIIVDYRSEQQDLKVQAQQELTNLTTN